MRPGGHGTRRVKLSKSEAKTTGKFRLSKSARGTVVRLKPHRTAERRLIIRNGSRPISCVYPSWTDCDARLLYISCALLNGLWMLHGLPKPVGITGGSGPRTGDRVRSGGSGGRSGCIARSGAFYSDGSCHSASRVPTRLASQGEQRTSRHDPSSDAHPNSDRRTSQSQCRERPLLPEHELKSRGLRLRR